MTSPPLTAAYTIFNDTSTAGHATITNHGGDFQAIRRRNHLQGSSTADSAILIANGSDTEVRAVRFFLMVLRLVAPRGWKFLTMVTWTLAATNRV